MEYKIIFNSVYTPNMCEQICGNHTDDFSTTWENIGECVKMIEASVSRFYIIGFGFVEIIGSFGHKATADFILSEYGIKIPFERITVKMKKGWVIVPAYSGKRLEEGAIELPKGAKLVPMVTKVNMK